MTTETKTYTYTQVRDMISEAIEYTKDKDLWFEFEARLNDNGLNGNNWDNEHLYEQFMEDLSQSFIN